MENKVMKLWEFINKYLGTNVDYDGVYGFQCVDLFRQYCQDVWCVPHLGGVEGAKDIWFNYEKMPNEMKYTIKTQEPKIGDVVIFDKSSTNKYGHIAIVVWIEKDELVVFEQDGFKQDGAKLVSRKYDNVLGYLTKR